MVTETETVPITLLDLLSNTLVLYRTTPYLPISSLLALAATSKSLRYLLYNTPHVFRYVDLTAVSAAAVSLAAIDSGGAYWRHQQIDEAVTEEGFYSGPLRGVFSRLNRSKILKDVQTLILDGVSTPAELIREIICDEPYNVKILSIREAKNLNERKLMQVLNYAIRGSRAPGTPKLKGLYIFGPKDPKPIPELMKQHLQNGTVCRRAGATSSAQIVARYEALDQDRLYHSQRMGDAWFQSSGKMIQRSPLNSAEWAETIRNCEGIIAFDAVCCRGPRHRLPFDVVDGPGTPIRERNARPAIATVALGPAGCDCCHSAPELPPVYGYSPEEHFPLLAPPPLHSSNIRDAKVPSLLPDTGCNGTLILRCEDCLRNRWCERCNKWWCEDCYTIPTYGNSPNADVISMEQWTKNKTIGGKPKECIKVVNGFCIEDCFLDWLWKMGVARDCFECGRTCEDCSLDNVRYCRSCFGGYCITHNEGSSDKMCDWCNLSPRRMRGEMY